MSLKFKLGVIIWSIIVLGLMFGGLITEEYKCANYEDMTGMQTQYKVFDGCYVKTDKGWFLREQLRDISVGQQ